MPTPVAALSVAAVALAGVVFIATNHTAPPVETARPVTASPRPSITPTTAPEVTEPPKKHRPAVKRGNIYVEVYNNSGISGLAGSTASRASGAGWQVVGSDNWYGTIAASTVYYPARLKAAAKLLARDLGIKRLKPAIDPMRFDRLTVILTADYR